MILSIFRQLYIHGLFLRRRICLLIMMSLVILILGGGFAAASSSQMKEARFPPIHLVIVASSEDETTKILLEQLSRAPELFPYVTLQAVESQTEAELLVENGAATGALILPEDFFAWINGSTTSAPLLLVHSLSGLEHAIFRTIGNSLLHMLAESQRGVALTCQAVQLLSPAHLSYDTAWREINLRFFSIAFDQSTRFDDVLVTGPEAFSNGAHYILCISLCFAMLTTPMLHSALSLETFRLWIGRLQGVGLSAVQYTLSLLLTTAIGYVIMLLPLCAGFFIVLTLLGEAVGLSALILPVLLITSLFLAGFSFLLANVNAPLLSGLITCLVAIASLITAGGLVPKVLLPSALRHLSAYSPVLWLRNLFGASLLDLGTPFVGAFLALCAVTALIWCGCFLQSRRFRRVCL